MSRLLYQTELPRPGATASPLTESNRRPSPYHGDALPTELRGRSRRICRPARPGATGHDRLGEHTRHEIAAARDYHCRRTALTDGLCDLARGRPARPR